ncbi:Anoctamin [Fasciola gigantica]|uniref:Anoctamin n=1 Tax=Fasciola gigantica TaxID=46835 RepID=A0A504YA16_FASGI|nr:Anoctamin [Fasciola gigantica]
MFLLEYQRKITELQKKVTETGRNVISRTQKWRRMSTVSSKDCDLVLTFQHSATIEDVQWFITLLHKRVPELVVRPYYHRTSSQHALYLTACYRDLLIGAEELGLKKSLLPEYGGGLREFSMDELDLFTDASEEASFLTSGERSYVVHHYLIGLRAVKGDSWKEILTFRDGQPMIRALESAGLIQQVFPVHDASALKELNSVWVRSWTFKQPLNEIRRYFGVQIALYFAWLGHYTAALLVPSLIGLLVWLLLDPKKSTFYYLFMAIFTLLWSSVYLETWKRTSSYLTYRWGTWDAPPPLLEEPRVAFKGKLTLCPITGRVIRTYPLWRRKLIICCFTGPVITICLCAVIFVTLLFVRIQEHVDQMTRNADSDGWGVTLLVYTPKVLLALVIALMEVGYRQVAIWLTDIENHRLDVEYHTHLVGKFILLQCMNSFYSLFYTAFYLRDLEMLQQQLTTLLITRQCIGNLREVFFPYSQSRLRQFLLSFRYERHKQKENGGESPSGTRTTAASQPLPTPAPRDGDTNQETELRQRADPFSTNITENESPDEQLIHAPEREATLLPYDGPDEDFLEMFIQFGYISMFSCVFPVAAALALLNNVVEIRADAFKLIHSFQRPFVHPAHNIGVWQVCFSR